MGISCGISRTDVGFFFSLPPLPLFYARGLRLLKGYEANVAVEATTTPKPNPSFPERDIRSGLDPTKNTTTIFALSAELEGLLGTYDDFSKAIVDLLLEGDVLFQDPAGASFFRLGDSLAVKVTGKDAVTEHASLSYLEEHISTFPAPRPHGLVCLDSSYLLFMTYIPGLTLEEVWPQLQDSDKQALSDQLNAMFRELRSLPLPDSSRLGGVQGDGCKDGRRTVRATTKPIMGVEQFKDWVFAGSRHPSPLYAEFLRSLTPVSERCVFTHSDVRPANIIVKVDTNGSWRVAAIVDWESSGFYPDYWESVKITNNLGPTAKSDWYKYLPTSISPSQCPTEWLVDRLWGAQMENN